MNFKTITEMLAAQTNLSAKTIVMVANVLAVPDTIMVDLRTAEARAQFAKSLPEARNAIEEHKTITAIKVVRDASRGAQFILPDGQDVMGLKDAKDAVEAAFAKEIVAYRALQARY